MTATLRVPYIGQVGFGADEHGNDCGAAAAAMVLRFAGVNIPSVDVLYNEVKPSGNLYLSFGDLLRIWGRRGVKGEYDAGVALKDLFWILSGGVPVVALIRYGGLAAIRPNSFGGSHFVTVIGMDLDTVYIHDPLNVPSTGEGVAVPMRMWLEAWSTVGDENPQQSILLPVIPGTSVTSPIVMRVVYPKDKDGCWIRSVPGDLSLKTRIRGVGYDPTFSRPGSAMKVYAERDGWGKVSLDKDEWVCLAYTREP